MSEKDKQKHIEFMKKMQEKSIQQCFKKSKIK